MERSSLAGFSLAELLVALAILGVLAALAWPAYTAVLQQGRRSDAIDALLRLQVAQEQWRATRPQYASLDELQLDPLSSDGHYQLAITAHTAAGYHATATPVTAGPQGQDACGVFAVHQDGPDHGSGYADARCWRR